MKVGEKLAEQMKQAMKGRRKDRLLALRLLKTELQVAQASGEEFSEVDVVKSLARTLRRSAEEYDGLGLPEHAEAVRMELQTVEEFLPPQMSRSELTELIGALVEENDYGPRDMGKVMKAVMGQYRDVVDGRAAREIAAEELARRG